MPQVNGGDGVNFLIEDGRYVDRERQFDQEGERGGAT